MEAYYRTPDYVCSVSFAALDALTQYRNTPVPAENTWEMVGQKVVGALGYAALIIVGAVETLVRGLFGLIVYLASLLPIENEKFQGLIGILEEITIRGAKDSAQATASSVLCFWQNFCSSQVTPTAILSCEFCQG